jgi:hypothetical protein
MRQAILLGIMVLSGAVQAQDVIATEEVMIANRVLTSAEVAEYRSLENTIRCNLESSTTAEGAEGSISALLNLVAGSSLFEGAQDSLIHFIGEEAFANAQDPPRLAKQLIAAQDSRLQGLALNYFFNTGDSWESDAQVCQRLDQLLSAPDASENIRVGILWLFRYTDKFAAVEPVAVLLAGDHSRNASLAHQAAEVIVSAHEDEGATSSGLAMSDVRAIREEAMRQDCQAVGAVRSLLATAEDRSEPEWVRGNAVEAIARCPQSRATEAAVEELLEPHNWFFGASGAHFRIHSLALLIPAVAELPSPRGHRRLVALQSQLRFLRPGEREYVEWVLKNALGEHQEIFYGPSSRKMGGYS